MWNCSSCGASIPSAPYAGYSDLSYEYCGPCNTLYYQERERQERLEEEDRRRRSQERWDMLVAKYGVDTAAEIIGDSG